MANIREFRDFKGDDVVLLWLTRGELPALRHALATARIDGHATLTFGACNLVLKTHHATGVNLSAAAAEICFTDADGEHLNGLLDGLLQGTGPGHQYIDIDWPVPTLMISIDEYPPNFGDDG